MGERVSPPAAANGHVSGEAEVEDFHATVAGDEEVLRLQVAVDDPLLVGGGQRPRDLRAVVHGLAGRQRAVCELHPQRLAVEQLGDGVCHAVRSAEVEDGQDLGMRERGHRLGLALEARQGIRVQGEVLRAGP